MIRKPQRLKKKLHFYLNQPLINLLQSSLDTNAVLGVSTLRSAYLLQNVDTHFTDSDDLYFIRFSRKLDQAFFFIRYKSFEYMHRKIFDRF